MEEKDYVQLKDWQMHQTVEKEAKDHGILKDGRNYFLGKTTPYIPTCIFLNKKIYENGVPT